MLSHEFVVGAAFDDLAVVEDHDDVGVLDGRESVGDDEDGASFHERIHAALDEGFGACIDGRGGFVEDHHWWIADGCAGDGEKLTLSLAESGAVAGEDGVVTLRQHTDEAVSVGELCCGDAFFIAGGWIAVADIFHDAAGEEVDILKNDAKGAAQIVLADFFDVDAIVEDGAVVDVVKPIDEVGDGGFSRSGRANEGNFLSRLGVEGDVVEDLLGWCVTKIDVLETNIAAQATVLSAAILHTLPGPDAGVALALCEGTVCVFCDIDKDDAAVVNLVGFIHERKNTRGTGERCDDGVELAGDLRHRHGKVAREREKAGDHADGHRTKTAETEIGDAADGHGCANEGDDDVLEIAEAVHDRHHGHSVAVGKIGGFFPGFVAALHFFLGFVLVAENLDDFFAVDDLFNVAIEGGERGLLLHKIRAGKTGDEAGDLDHTKNTEHHENGQPDANRQHGNENSDKCEKRAHSCGEGLAHHLAQGVNVVGVEAHDVAVFVAIEITDRQALHFGEHVVAHAFHGALRDERHDPAVSQRGDDAAGQKQTHAKDGVEQAAHVGISNADERPDVIVDERAQKKRACCRSDGADQHTDDDNCEQRFVGAKIIEQPFQGIFVEAFEGFARKHRAVSWAHSSNPPFC